MHGATLTLEADFVNEEIQLVSKSPAILMVCLYLHGYVGMVMHVSMVIYVYIYINIVMYRSYVCMYGYNCICMVMYVYMFVCMVVYVYLRVRMHGHV